MGLLIIHIIDSSETIGNNRKQSETIKPKWLVDEIRFDELRQAVDKYLHEGLEIPIEWIKEYNQLLPTNEKYIKK